MVNEENTRYIIRYAFDLNSKTITMPAGSELVIEGGIIENGTMWLLEHCVNRNSQAAVLIKDAWVKFVSEIYENRERYTEQTLDGDDTIMEQWIKTFHDDVETFLFDVFKNKIYTASGIADHPDTTDHPDTADTSIDDGSTLRSE